MKNPKRVSRRSGSATHNLPESLKDVTCRVLTARGVMDAERLDLSLAKLLSTEKFSGIFEAADIVIEVAKSKGKILIVGDYDADGATSTALALTVLSSMGIKNTGHIIPNRFEFGYGLSVELVETAFEKYKPDLILTVDNGISSVEGVERAKKLGIRVVITDHHLPGDHLPLAEAIVNPCLANNNFQSRNLAGVGVIFYLLGAIRAKLRESDWFVRRSIPVPNLGSFVDLVALGTVADLVPMDDNNRRLVSAGLRLIKSGRGNKGILALLKQAGRSLSTLNADDLAFAVAPRLNAAGRMSNMSLGIDCLTEKDNEACARSAKTLSDLNDQRKKVENTMQEQAILIAEEIVNDYKKEELPFGFCLYKESWHEGVVGIVASRLKEVFYRPVIIFAMGKDNQLKGSARSIEGIHIRDVLAEASAKNPSLIKRFGGHAMAAGLTLRPEMLEEFNIIFSNILSKKMNQSLIQQTIVTDGVLEAADFELALAKELYEVTPWGQGFPPPTFDGDFDIMYTRIVGGLHVSLLLGLPGSDKQLYAIAFNALEERWCAKGVKARLVYKLMVNYYRGRESLQLNILYGTVADCSVSV